MQNLANLEYGDPFKHLDKDQNFAMGGLYGLWGAQEQENRLAQQQKALQNIDYQNTQDSLLAAQAAAMNNPADIDVIRRGKLGQALSQDATGRFDQGVLPGKIATTNAENKTKLTSAQLEDMIHQLDIAASALETPSPLGVNVIEDEGLRNKVAKEVQRSGRSPKEIVQAMSNSVKSALANSPHFMEQANLKAIEGTNKMNEIGLQNKGALERAVYSENRQDARQDKADQASTVRANVALIQNLQAESKALEEQITNKQLLDPNGKNKTIQDEIDIKRFRVDQNKKLMDRIRANMKSNPELLDLEPSGTPKPKRTIKTKSGKEVIVEGYEE